MYRTPRHREQLGTQVGLTKTTPKPDPMTRGLQLTSRDGGSLHASGSATSSSSTLSLSSSLPVVEHKESPRAPPPPPQLQENPPAPQRLKENPPAPLQLKETPPAPPQLKGNLPPAKGKSLEEKPRTPPVEENKQYAHLLSFSFVMLMYFPNRIVPLSYALAAKGRATTPVSTPRYLYTLVYAHTRVFTLWVVLCSSVEPTTLAVRLFSHVMVTYYDTIDPAANQFLGGEQSMCAEEKMIPRESVIRSKLEDTCVWDDKKGSGTRCHEKTTHYELHFMFL